MHINTANSRISISVYSADNNKGWTMGVANCTQGRGAKDDSGEVVMGGLCRDWMASTHDVILCSHEKLQLNCSPLLSKVVYTFSYKIKNDCFKIKFTDNIITLEKCFLFCFGFFCNDLGKKEIWVTSLTICM